MKQKEKWFRQMAILLIIVICLIVFSAEARADSEIYSTQNSPVEKFKNIQEQITRSTFSIQTYKAKDAYKDITKALDDFLKIHTLVQKIENVDEVIDEVADGLLEIANTYKKVASFSQDIASHRNSELSNLAKFSEKSLKNEEQLKVEISELKSRNKLLQHQLDNTIDEFDFRTIDASFKANKSLINSKEAQCRIWDNYHSNQNKIIDNLSLSGRKLDLLFHILNVNADVYREAANVALLRRSAKEALTSLDSLTNIQDIIGDLENSWLELDDLISEIANAEFALDVE